jgi:hypothetical protein
VLWSIILPNASKWKGGRPSVDRNQKNEHRFTWPVSGVNQNVHPNGLDGSQDRKHSSSRTPHRLFGLTAKQTKKGPTLTGAGPSSNEGPAQAQATGVHRRDTEMLGSHT